MPVAQIPTAVARAAAEADQRIGQLRTPAGTAPVAAPSPTPAPAPVAAPPAPTVTPAPPAPVTAAPAGPITVPTQPAAPSAGNPSDAEVRRLSGELEQTRRQLRENAGRHGGELDGLRREMERLQGELAELIAENAQLRMPGTGVPTPAAARPASQPADLGDIATVALSVVPDANRQEFGEKLYTDVAAMIRAAFAHAAPRLIEPVTQSVDTLTAETAAQRFWLDVEALCPGAKRINDDAAVNGFGEFLNQDVPGIPGYRNREMAEQAAATGNHARLANVVQRFLDGKAAPVTPQPPPPPLTPGTPPPPPLESLVDPGSAGGGGGPATPPAMVKHSEYVRFMEQAANGRLKLTRAQYNAELAKFQAAIRERRYDYKA